jgi:hypothetical protein
MLKKERTIRNKKNSETMQSQSKRDDSCEKSTSHNPHGKTKWRNHTINCDSWNAGC